MGPRLNAPSAQFTYFDVHTCTLTRRRRVRALYEPPQGAVGERPQRPDLCAPSLQRAHRDWSCSRSTSQRAPASSCRRWTRSTGAFGGGRGQGMPDGNKSSASRLSLSAMLPQATCSQPSRRGLQQASSARHSAEGVPGMDALGGRMDTCLQVVNARPDAQSRCRRAARSRAELVVVWCTCREQKGMPEHTVSERLPSQLSAWAHQLLRNMCRRDDQACAVQGSWRCTWARPPHLESRHPAVRPTTRELRELKCTIRSLLR